MSFSYSEFTTRNIGFVTEGEQQRLRDATVFVCGTGGMGGSAVMSLVRAGVGHLVLADIDAFEVSNLNRQAFCFADTIGMHKAHATAEIARRINPGLQIEVLEDEWSDHVARLVSSADVVINGTDDLAASVLLYRSSRYHERTVIDAYAAPLPSVYVTRPQDPSPEERLGYPTLDLAWDELTPEIRREAFLREIEHVMLHSSSAKHIDLEIAAEMAAGKRSRMSFAPMVTTTGNLMAYEAIAAILGKPHGADHRGWFFNPYVGKVERPFPEPIARLLMPFVRRRIAKLMAG